MEYIWKLTDEDLPPHMDSVLFLTKDGKIHKGFLNTKDLWIIQNNNWLIARLIRNSRDVVAWTCLPDMDDRAWINPETRKPEEYSRVLIRNEDAGDVDIAYITKTVWIIRNHPKDYVTLWAKTNSLWMPLPEIPEHVRQALERKG